MTKISYLAVSVAIMALQGCSAAPMPEDIAESQAAVTTCATMGGVFPTKAALAVAMGIELGRFEPSKDLYNNNYQYVSLSGSAKCIANNCRNTKAILGQQFADSTWTGGASVFDPTTYKTELVNGFAYQTTLNGVLPSRGKPQPPDHKATLKRGPIDLGTQTCGKHYVFQIDKPNGTALTQSEKDAMVYWFCYFGMSPTGTAAVGVDCSNNPYVGFMTTTTGCDAGRFCIAIDPDYGDQGTPSSTTSGAAPTYPMNRVYAPDDPTYHANKSELINTPCTRTTGVSARLKSQCATAPRTCDYLYCM